MFFWITFWLLQVFVQMWKHIEYYNVHHDYVDGFNDEEEEENDDDDDDDDFDTDLEDEDEDEDVKSLASEEAVKEEDKEEEDKQENKNDFLTEEEFVREFVQIIKRNIDDGEFVYDDSWLYQSLRREIN